MTRGQGDDELAARRAAKEARLARILRIARTREAKNANAEVQKRSKAIERARQARVRAKRNRS